MTHFRGFNSDKHAPLRTQHPGGGSQEAQTGSLTLARPRGRRRPDREGWSLPVGEAPTEVEWQNSTGRQKSALDY